MPEPHASLLEQFRSGRRTALARAITIVENERTDFQRLLDALHSDLGRAHRIGITGPPGAGKSTLTAALIERYRARDERIGVIAVDPTSPFTGGALLGDRIRMNDVALDADVFIRSMATRGSLGGLALSTKEVADVMDAYGFDRIIIETVGVGQSELDIAAAADSTVVALVPESGDSIQAMKAGLMEAADLFVINKADRPGAQRLAKEIELMIHFRLGQSMRGVPSAAAHHGVDLSRVSREGTGGSSRTTNHEPRARPSVDAGPQTTPRTARTVEERRAARTTEEIEGWRIPVMQTVAADGTGVDELLSTLDRHREWLEQYGELERRRSERIRERVREVTSRRVGELVWREGPGEDILREALPALESGETSPYEVAARIVRAALG